MHETLETMKFMGPICHVSHILWTVPAFHGQPPNSIDFYGTIPSNK